MRRRAAVAVLTALIVGACDDDSECREPAGKFQITTTIRSISSVTAQGVCSAVSKIAEGTTTFEITDRAEECESTPPLMFKVNDLCGVFRSSGCRDGSSDTLRVVLDGPDAFSGLRSVYMDGCNVKADVSAVRATASDLAGRASTTSSGGCTADQGYHDNGDGTVANCGPTKSGGGLLWQREVDDGTLSLKQAQDYCADLELDGDGWRLPTIAELQTIVASPASGDESDPPPATTIESLRDTTPKAELWSSTLQSDGIAWTVSFSDGEPVGVNVGDSHHVRCVRAFRF